MYTNWVFWHFSYAVWFLFKVSPCFSISFYMSPSYTVLSFVWDVPPDDNLPLSLSLSASPLSASMDGLFWPLSLWHGVNLLQGCWAGLMSCTWQPAGHSQSHGWLLGKRWMALQSSSICRPLLCWFLIPKMSHRQGQFGFFEHKSSSSLLLVIRNFVH